MEKRSQTTLVNCTNAVQFECWFFLPQCFRSWTQLKELPSTETVAHGDLS